MLEKPAFIQGVYLFEGQGLHAPVSFTVDISYTVPADKRAQTIYFRAGNASPELIYLVLTSAGRPIRYFPVAAKGAIHVPLAVVEDISPGSKVAVLIAAPKDLRSSVVLDVGFMEID